MAGCHSSYTFVSLRLHSNQMQRRHGSNSLEADFEFVSIHILVDVGIPYQVDRKNGGLDIALFESPTWRLNT
jgi:hypothetical protein